VTALIFFGEKGEMKRPGFEKLLIGGMLAGFFLFPSAAVWADDDPPVSETKEVAPKSDLDNLKAEWEAVREQQIRMIREKEDQLEKLKEEIFAKMKALNAPVASQPMSSNATEAISQNLTTVPANSAELEAQKKALQAERQKFFVEMNRQKESLLKLQASLDEKAKQLEAERERFEREKKTAAH